MEWIPIKTRRLIPPKDDLFAVFDESLKDLREGDIVLVTSKVVAIGEGRCVPIEDVTDKQELVRREAQKYVPPQIPDWPALTITHNLVIPNAGIDESNANGYYILWPENPDKSAKEIWEYLRKKFSIQNIGVILTDSHVSPLRWGVSGVSLAHYGLEPLVDLRGKQDLFGRPLTMTKQNVPDSIAAFGVLLMGESDESTPLLILRGFPFTPTSRDTNPDLRVDPDHDLYKPLLDVFSKDKKF